MAALGEEWGGGGEGEVQGLGVFSSQQGQHCLL